jgi:hypothetical protein
MHRHDQWLYYILGALLTLVWKWQRYAYSMKGIQTANPDGTLNPPIKFWQASKKWFELETFGSQISWGVTIGVVWVLGALFIDRIGVDWLFGGILASVPVAAPWLFLFGSISEMTVPAVAKWIASKIPFASFDSLRTGPGAKPGE